MERQKLIIDRSRWLRGKEMAGRDSRDSYLLRKSDGKMCCLGFVGVQLCGLEEDQIADVAAPANPQVAEAFAAKIPGLVYRDQMFDDLFHTHTAAALMMQNDSDADEKEIADLFDSIGIDVEFIN